jgi:tRNA pseudouridine32 synthase/23S rRNA pseudouridine746 synthase
MTRFRKFQEVVSPSETPGSFTYPFDYTPHALTIKAAESVMTDLAELPISVHNFQEIGKMFGVLVVKSNTGEIGYLAAFSGKLQSGNHYDYFVPPIFDMLNEEGFYRQGEEKLNELNARIKTLENNNELSCLITNYNRSIQDLEFELAEAKDTFRKGKAKRKTLRKELEAKGHLEELAQIKPQHEKESHYQQHIIKELKSELSDQRKQKENALLPFSEELSALKATRKAKSNELQRLLFEEYNFLNAQGETKNVLSIFEGQIPPAGTGECAAPKLLQFAYAHQLQPLCMAEFWWGISPPKEIRKHGEYYPSCKSKCEPVLGHMLVGLNVDDNPRQTIIVEDEPQILFEDDYLLAIDKPHEMLSAPGKIDVPNVLDWARAKFPNATGPLLVHRLDQSTSGILLIAKDKDTHAALQRQFEQRTVKKRYEAVLSGELNITTGKIELPLRVDLDNRPRQLVCEEHGKPAETFYKVVETTVGQTRIHFFPATGRTHQLRVHAAHQLGLNTPILGDDLYGHRANRLHLHAAQLIFIHPTSNREITIKSPVPF